MTLAARRDLGTLHYTWLVVAARWREALAMRPELAKRDG